MRTAIAAAAVTSLIAATAGNADASISLRFNGFGNHIDVRIFLYDHNDAAPTNLLYGNLSGPAGYYRYEGAITNPTQFVGNFFGFCMEPMTGTSAFSNFVNFDTVDPTIAPDPGVPIPSADGMGPERSARLARAIFAAFESRGGISHWNELTALEAAALNLAIWEIIYERADTALDTTTGFIRFDTAILTTTTPTVEQQANIYLAAATNPEAPAAEGLLAITSAQYQDLLIPTPGAGLLAATAGVCALRRRRR